MPIKFKAGKKKLLKKYGKKYKVYSMSVTIDLPKMLDAFVFWVHPDMLNREQVDRHHGFFEAHPQIEEDEFLMYRALMLEAGYYPHFCVVKTAEHPMASFTFPKSKMNERMKEFLAERKK